MRRTRKRVRTRHEIFVGREIELTGFQELSSVYLPMQFSGSVSLKLSGVAQRQRLSPGSLVVRTILPSDLTSAVRHSPLSGG